MHWFWRAVIAVGVGSAAGAIFIAAAQTVPPPASSVVQILLIFSGALALPQLVALWTYGLLTRRYQAELDNELRCRKCNYILRGLTEPRCPECGEGI